MAVVLELLLAGGTEAWPDGLHDRLSPAVALSQGLALVPMIDEIQDRLGPATTTLWSASTS